MTPNLRTLKLVNYKGFADHTISFRSTNVMVGANNAGKSTALSALRLIAAMLPTARRMAPTTVGTYKGIRTRGWPITATAIDSSAFSVDNIRHDFRPDETRLEVTVNNGTKLIAAWATDEPEEEGGLPPVGMFYVVPPPDSYVAPRTAAKTLVPEIAVVPTLTPLDDKESAVSAETLRRHISGRRSSRYFRNALYQLSGEQWDSFSVFVYEQTPEIGNLTISRSFGSSDDVYDLFYEESETRHEREVGWAGDGIQIWLQVLFHLWRQSEADVLILDEPDVFLHPDLQRRLARLVFNRGQQTTLATHSIEILAEAEPGSALWVDRSRRTSERPRKDGSLALMGRRLGSGFELGVGRALRSRSVLFVEGDDAPILALIARKLGFHSVASAENYATVPLGGFSRNWRAGAFAETVDALGGNVEAFVILDSDLRSQEAIDRETSELRQSGAQVHVWRRRELENYLLNDLLLSKASGLRLPEAQELLDRVINAERDEARIELTHQRLDEKLAKNSNTAGLSNKTVLSKANEEFEQLWSSRLGRLGLVDAKGVIRALNRELQSSGKRTINTHTLAKAATADSLPEEVTRVFESLETLIQRP